MHLYQLKKENGVEGKYMILKITLTFPKILFATRLCPCKLLFCGKKKKDPSMQLPNVHKVPFTANDFQKVFDSCVSCSGKWIVLPMGQT